MEQNIEQTPLSQRTLLLAKEIIKRKIDPEVNSLNTFSIACDMSKTWIKTFNATKFKPSTIRAIKDRFPMVNIDWLLKGEGDMFFENYQPIDGNVLIEENNDVLSAQVAVLFQQVANLLEANKRLQAKIDEIEEKIG